MYVSSEYPVEVKTEVSCIVLEGTGLWSIVGGHGAGTRGKSALPPEDKI